MRVGNTEHPVQSLPARLSGKLGVPPQQEAFSSDSQHSGAGWGVTSDNKN